MAAHWGDAAAAWSVPPLQFPPAESIWQPRICMQLCSGLVTEGGTHQAAVEVLEIQQLDSHNFLCSFALGFPYLQ